MERSKLEGLWLRRAVIEACAKVADEYEHLREEAELDAHAVENDCMEGHRSYHEHEDGECPSAVADREYESYWAQIVSTEDQAFESAPNVECGSIREVLADAEDLARAFLAARNRGCESSLYGIHKITPSNF